VPDLRTRLLRENSQQSFSRAHDLGLVGSTSNNFEECNAWDYYSEYFNETANIQTGVKLEKVC